jgi:hypothetical protein
MKSAIDIEIEGYEITPEPEIKLGDLSGFIQTTSVDPNTSGANKPRSFKEQFVIYSDPSASPSPIYRLYWYDFKNNKWIYVSGTAA